ncbi:hypothetical protein LIER_32171 [Lithospermum erythrorhizon]|uniref:Uncharacterized protein n=1 Tax=Lithospermum erythrorhizon TaxID=34254 RepID=A0AAV3RUW8_LITER
MAGEVVAFSPSPPEGGGVPPLPPHIAAATSLCKQNLQNHTLNPPSPMVADGLSGHSVQVTATNTSSTIVHHIVQAPPNTSKTYEILDLAHQPHNNSSASKLPHNAWSITKQPISHALNSHVPNQSPPYLILNTNSKPGATAPSQTSSASNPAFQAKGLLPSHQAIFYPAPFDSSSLGGGNGNKLGHSTNPCFVFHQTLPTTNTTHADNHILSKSTPHAIIEQHPTAPKPFYAQATMGDVPSTIMEDYDCSHVANFCPVASHEGKPSVVFKKSDKARYLSMMKHVLIGKFSHGRPTIAVIKEFFVKLKLKGAYNISLFDATSQIRF